MPTALNAIKTYLSEQYLNCVGLSLTVATLEDFDTSDKAIWQWQDGDMRLCDSEASASGAVVFDSDVGVCLFLQSFTRKSDLRAQLSRALSIKSQLAPRRMHDDADVDAVGRWSATIIWICEPDAIDEWINQIAVLRTDTAHFEEVPVDVLVGKGPDWQGACESHGFPKLLLQTRSALLRNQIGDAIKWINADPIIRTRLDAALVGVSQDLSEMASLTLQELKKVESQGSGDHKVVVGDSPPRPLYALEVHNFRNIDRLDFVFRGAHEAVTSNVVHGPNGTGKSALSEALSIALGGVSSRYLEYLQDSNEPNSKKRAKYLERYLTPLSAPATSIPTFRLNGGAQIPVSLVDEAAAKDQCAKLSGTLLSQSWAEHLTHIKAEELGAEIAGSYSHLAMRLVEFLDSSVAGAEGERAAFNREWGLRSNVSRDETAVIKIASSVLEGVMPSMKEARNRLALGAQPNWRYRDAFRSLSQRWEAWEASAANRTQLIARSKSKDERLNAIRSQIDAHNLLLGEAARLQQTLFETRSAVANACSDFSGQVATWAAWLRRPVTADVDPEIASAARIVVEELQRQLDAATQSGRALRERSVQIESVMSFVQQHWELDHADSCPICDSNVESRGGIGKVLSDVAAEVQTKIQDRRIEFAELRQRLSEATAALARVAPSGEPLTLEQQANLQSALRLLISPDFSTESLDNPDVEGQIIRLWKFVGESSFGFMAPRSDENIGDLAATCTKRISLALERFAATSEGPDKWKRLKALVTQELAVAIEEHLPKTIQALWWELARSMMPAPWQYPGSVVFAIDHGRSQTEARLVVRGGSKIALAAHILNSAELHNLGVAWFFARYLTHGRYFFSSIILDDPAGQMDEPSFRDFCRFLQAIVRLHRLNSLPLTLVLFLHQDGRSLDAARATDGVVHFLRWHRGTASVVKRQKMTASPIAPPKPYRILRRQ